MTPENFIQFVRDRCKYYGVKCFITKTKHVRFGKSFCSGYFDSVTRTLRSSTLKSDWLEILIHEYCHLTQWVDRLPLWIKTDELKSFQLWEEWLAGKDVHDIDAHIDMIRDIELDNERRSVALIKKLSLPIDVKAYTKRANSYIMFYNYMKKSRRWCGKNAPYRNAVIVNAMPDRFCLNYSKMSSQVEAVYDKVYA